MEATESPATARRPGRVLNKPIGHLARSLDDASQGHALEALVQGWIGLLITWIHGLLVLFVWFPLAQWSALQHPAPLVVAASVATVEAIILIRKTAINGKLTSRMVVIDMLSAAVVMALSVTSLRHPGSNRVGLDCLPYLYGATGVAAIGLRRKTAMLVPATLAALWSILTWRGGLLYVLSDDLGFAIWFTVPNLANEALRQLSRRADSARKRELAVAQARMDAETSRQIAEREAAGQHAIVVAHEAGRVAARNLLHEEVLPVLRFAGGLVDTVPWKTDGDLRSQAARLAYDVEAFMQDMRPEQPTGFEAAVWTTVRSVQADDRLALTDSYDISGEVDPNIAEVLIGALREGLRNVRHSRGDATAVAAPAVLRIRAMSCHIVISIRDFGKGFDPGIPRIKHGMAHSIANPLAAIGGQVVYQSLDDGTMLRMEWHHADCNH